MMKKTLVLGASIKAYRYANKAVKKLMSKGIDAVCIGKVDGQIDGIIIHATKVFFKDIDTVTIYLNKKNQKDYYDYILNLSPRRVIFNPGTENKELEKILRTNGILVENACTLVLLSIDEY